MVGGTRASDVAEEGLGHMGVAAAALRGNGDTSCPGTERGRKRNQRWGVLGEGCVLGSPQNPSPFPLPAAPICIGNIQAAPGSGSLKAPKSHGTLATLRCPWGFFSVSCHSENDRAFDGEAGQRKLFHQHQQRRGVPRTGQPHGTSGSPPGGHQAEEDRADREQLGLW